MRVSVAPGVALHLERYAGRLPPVLLVHGLASNLRLWDGVARQLAITGHEVVAVDLRGHGQSDRPDDGYGVATVAGDVAALIEALSLDRPVVAGQSWGGNVVLELAWRQPQLVAGLALVDGGWLDLQARFPVWEDCAEVLAPPDSEGWRLANIESHLRAAHLDWPDSGIEGALACFEHRPDGTVRPWLTRPRHMAALRGLWDHRPASRYPGVEAPVLLVPAGSPTSAAPAQRAEVRAAESALRTVETCWMAGHHDLHAQHPTAVAELLSTMAHAHAA